MPKKSEAAKDAKKKKAPGKADPLAAGIAAARAARKAADPPGLARALTAILDAKLPLFGAMPYDELHDLTFWLWDRAGYSDPMPVKLWTAWYEHCLAANDRIGATSGMALVAWHQATRGALGDVHAMVDLWRHTFPRDERFSSYGDAILFDAAFSAGVWAEDEGLARVGRDAFLEYLTRSGEAPDAVHSFLRCAVRSALLFSWKEDLERWWDPYVKGLALTAAYNHAEMERLRHDALVALRAGRIADARDSFRALTEHAYEEKLGPEWVAEGSVEAARMSALLGSRTDAISDLKWAHEVMDRYGVIVFERPIKLLYDRIP